MLTTVNLQVKAAPVLFAAAGCDDARVHIVDIALSSLLAVVNKYRCRLTPANPVGR